VRRERLIDGIPLSPRTLVAGSKQMEQVMAPLADSLLSPCASLPLVRLRTEGTWSRQREGSEGRRCDTNTYKKGVSVMAEFATPLGK